MKSLKEEEIPSGANSNDGFGVPLLNRFELFYLAILRNKLS